MKLLLKHNRTDLIDRKDLMNQYSLKKIEELLQNDEI